jgi:hypothetical protein
MPRRPRSRTSQQAWQKRNPIAAGGPSSLRTLSKPRLTEPFHVEVDRQLKSGHGTYETAEKAALAIKKLYPRLQVGVFDAITRRHTIIEQPKPANNSNQNRLPSQAGRNALHLRKSSAAETAL